MDYSATGSYTKTDIFYMNIRSLRCHHDQLVTLFDDFEVKPLLVCLCETWLTNNDPNELYWLDDYCEIEVKNRESKLGGGLAFYARDDLNYSVREIQSNVEHIVITIFREKLCPLNLCLIYRPPDAKVDFFDNLDNLLTELMGLSGELLLLGDLNIDVLDYTDQEHKKLQLLLKMFNLSVQTYEPTRETSTTSKCIDLCIATNDIEVETLKYNISDHYELRFPILYEKMYCKADGQKCLRDFSGFSNADHHLKFLFFIYQELRKCQHDTIDGKIQFSTGTLKIASDKFAPFKSIEATDEKINRDHEYKDINEKS